MGKILTFIGGCITGILGVFAVAVMSEQTSTKLEESDSTSSVAQEEADIE